MRAYSVWFCRLGWGPYIAPSRAYCSTKGRRRGFAFYKCPACSCAGGEHCSWKNTEDPHSENCCVHHLGHTGSTTEGAWYACHYCLVLILQLGRVGVSPYFRVIKQQRYNSCGVPYISSYKSRWSRHWCLDHEPIVSTIYFVPLLSIAYYFILHKPSLLPFHPILGLQHNKHAF